MWCHPSEPSLSISRSVLTRRLTPPPDTNSQQLVKRWSVKSAPTLCIHIPIVTDLYGVDTGLLSSPSTGPCCRAEGSQVLQVWPSASALVTPCVLTSLRFLWLGRSAVYPSSHEQSVTHTLIVDVQHLHQGR